MIIVIIKIVVWAYFCFYTENNSLTMRNRSLHFICLLLSYFTISLIMKQKRRFWIFFGMLVVFAVLLFIGPFISYAGWDKIGDIVLPSQEGGNYSCPNSYGLNTFSISTVNFGDYPGLFEVDPYVHFYYCINATKNVIITPLKRMQNFDLDLSDGRMVKVIM